jgi:hypothetical protein
VVCEQRRVLTAELLEPGGECCVQAGAARFGEPVVGDFARQGVLEDVLDLALEGRRRAAADEVT